MKNQPLSSVNTKTVEMRLVSVKESIQRTRFVFIIMTIASTAILFTLWNASYSRDRTMAFGQKFRYSQSELSKLSNPCQILTCASELATDPLTCCPDLKQPDPPPKKMVPATAADNFKGDSATANGIGEAKAPDAGITHTDGKKTLVDEWYKSRSIQVDLLGIHLSVSDLPVIGSFSMVVITIWFFYSQRRENRALVTLLQDVHKESGGDIEVRTMVFHEVKNSLLFIKTEEDDDPLRGLKSQSAGTSPRQGPAKTSHKTKASAKDSVGYAKEKRTLTSTILSALSFLSFWTIVAIIARDLIALLMYSPTSGMNLRLGQILVLQVSCPGPDGFLMAVYPIILLVLFESVALLCAIYAWHLCKRCTAFSNANKETLQQFGRALRQDIDPRESTG